MLLLYLQLLSHQTPQFAVSPSRCRFTFYIHIKSRKIAVGLIYFSHFYSPYTNNRIVTSIAPFKSPHNNRFHHETRCLSLCTQVQYQRVRSVLYLMSHRPHLSTSKIHSRTSFKISVYNKTQGVTQKEATFLIQGTFLDYIKQNNIIYNILHCIYIYIYYI